MAEQTVAVGDQSYDAIADELEKRDFGTDEDDLKAYAEAGGGAAAAAGCAAVGAAIAAPLCASVGGAVAGKIYEFFSALGHSGPTDEEIARMERTRIFLSYVTVYQAFRDAQLDATNKTFAAVMGPTGATRAQASIWLAQAARSAGFWFVRADEKDFFPCEGCNTPTQYRHTRTEWGLPADPSILVPRNARELAAWQAYYKWTLGYMIHDLRASAALVLARQATRELKWNYNTVNAEVTIDMPQAEPTMQVERWSAPAAYATGVLMLGGAGAIAGVVLAPFYGGRKLQTAAIGASLGAAFGAFLVGIKRSSPAPAEPV